MTISFCWYQDICLCDLGHLWKWRLSEAFVLHNTHFVCRWKSTLSKEIKYTRQESDTGPLIFLQYSIRITENIFYSPIYYLNHTCIRIDHVVLWLYTYKGHFFLQRNDTTWSLFVWSTNLFKAFTYSKD